jgi:HSP90 family molecular chaperone
LIPFRHIADDLPLNVSRETLQSTRFLKQIRQVILKHLIQLFARLAVEDKEQFAALQASYGTVLKLGTVEDSKNRDKLAALTRFSTNQRNSTSLDEVCQPFHSEPSDLLDPKVSLRSILKTRSMDRSRSVSAQSNRYVM